MKIFIFKIITITTTIICFSCCTDMLDLKPKDKIDAQAMFNDPEGIKLYMANLYYQLPIEDFNYLRDGFNGWYGENMVSAMFTEEATHSQYQTHLQPDDFPWWDPAFKLIRATNILNEEIPNLQVNETIKKSLIGEVAFIKGFAYFGLVKRYGGVPIIDEVQEWEGDVEKLKIPRSTEKDTWDYVMEQLDIAADNLPDAWEGGQRRATRWVALALKTRAALHAASISKYGTKMELSGEAVDKGLVGIPSQFADHYYEQCIVAADVIMKSGRFGLYKPNPVSPEEAAENYRLLFAKPNQTEAAIENIFIKGYTKLGMGHNYEVYYGPAQTANGWPHPGRMNPNLELMDAYESYNKPGESSPLLTSDSPNDLTDYSGFSSTKNYYKFDTPFGIFEKQKKDARLWGTTILPGTQWKGTTIVIQAGYITKEGKPVIYSGDPYELNGKTYYVFGGPTLTSYSGFDLTGGNYTRTGASFKKFLDEDHDVYYGYNNSLTDWIELRYAEVLLNYAEAVVECGSTEVGSHETAKEALNKIRRRAGHTVDIPLTVDNVQRERLVELAFENKRYWDLIRRREYHIKHVNHEYHALLPILDLRSGKPEYIFVRSNIQRVAPFTFTERMYYHPIPGTASNGLIQNPQY